MKIFSSGKEMNMFFSLSFCRTHIYPWAADTQGAFLWESVLINWQKDIDI